MKSKAKRPRIIRTHEKVKPQLSGKSIFDDISASVKISLDKPKKHAIFFCDDDPSLKIDNNI